MTDTIDPKRSLGTLVRENPAYATVFESVGIDYCCGGDTTLEAACKDEGTDLDELCAQLADAETESDSEDWESHSELIDDVVSTHHQYLREELPSLEGLVHKVVRVHGENHPELRELRAEYLELAEEMERHIDEEEDDLFPIVEKLDRGALLTDTQRETLRDEISEMEADHEETANRLERLADLIGPWKLRLQRV